MVCPYCKDVVSEVDAIRCPSCEAAHHSDCWVAHGETCSVYGCEAYFSEAVLGCPWCEEVYQGRRNCMVCDSPLMSPQQCLAFVKSYDWVPMPLCGDADALLAAGYLRNSGVLARLSKKPPISMYPIGQVLSLWVVREQEDLAKRLMRELFERFTSCAHCGHVLFIDEQDCSYCAAEKEVDR